MITLSSADAQELATRALVACGTSAVNANSTAHALVAAEIDGQSGHGLSRVPAYAAQVRSGKINGHARPTLERTRPAAARVDAKSGFAYPALDLAIEALSSIVPENGVGAVGLFASHHIGQAGRTVERLAERGLIALIVSNTPSAMAFPGGARAMMGTNPLAFAAPLAGRPPLVIDLALSVVARSKIVSAQKAQQPIPPEWATDAAGKPTSDPAAALAGALAPVGGAKGASLALMVEVLCGALAGGLYGWEASSFLDDRGASPAVGQMLVAFESAAFSGGGFHTRMTDLLAAVSAEAGTRLPGDRRIANRERARVNGISLAPDLHLQMTTLANSGSNA
jgi:(2R)-3-sulfolactate dehydrogenase (NADP+)